MNDDFSRRELFLFIGFGFYIFTTLLENFSIISFIINFILFLLLEKNRNKFSDKWLYTAIIYIGSAITFLIVDDIATNEISLSSMIIYLFMYLYCIIRERVYMKGEIKDE